MKTIQGIACLMLVVLSAILKPESKTFKNLLPENQQLVKLIRENKSHFVILAIVFITAGIVFSRGMTYCISLFLL